MWRAAQAAGIPYWRLSSFYFFYFAFLGAWVPFWNLYLADLGYSARQIGVLTALVMATKIFAPSIWGWLADRTGRRLTIIRVGAFLALLSFMGIFLGKAYGGLILIVCLYSFFWNAVLAQFEVVTLSHLAGHFERYSQIRVWGSIGFILAVVGAGYLFDYLPLSYLPVLLALLLGGIWLGSLSVSAHTTGQVREQGRGLLSVLRQPALLAFLASCVFLQIAHGPYYTFYSIYLEGHGYNRGLIGQLWALGVLAEVVLFLFMHRMLARFSLRPLLLITLVIACGRWLIIGYYPESLTLLLLAQLGHAATFGAYHAVAIEMIRRFFTGGHQGQGQAIYSGVSFGAGGALGALASGWVWPLGPLPAFQMASLASLVALVLCLLWVRGGLVESTTREC